MGDLLDRSRELSERRADIAGGSDPVKEQYFKDYASKRGGKKHLAAMGKIDTPQVSVDFGK